MNLDAQRASRRLIALGYSQHYVNWLLAYHISNGSIEIFINFANNQKEYCDGRKTISSGD